MNVARSYNPELLNFVQRNSRELFGSSIILNISSQNLNWTAWKYIRKNPDTTLMTASLHPSVLFKARDKSELRVDRLTWGGWVILK